jgi:hypothetical protein
MANATWLTFFTEAENLARHFVAASPARGRSSRGW